MRFLSAIPIDVHPQQIPGRVLCVLALCVSADHAAADFAFAGDLSLRLDDSSVSDTRKQYRLRLNPEYRLSERWSMHAYAGTGDGYASGYNTADANNDEFHLRQLFARYETARGKLEAGILPPYKGRVSSTGLSKEGWVKGIRGVLQFAPGKFELVVGELDSLEARDAASLPSDINYAEIEFSGTINALWSYEGAFDRLLDDNFARGEVRYRRDDKTTYALEAIRNLSAHENKFVLSLEREIDVGEYRLEWFSFYAYAAEAFGGRAELTEDFLDFGHAFSTELSGAIARSDRFSWFAKIEVYETRTRGQLGIEIELN